MNEEDIKILEDKLKLNATTKFDWFGEKEFQSLGNLINRIKELEEIEESHRKENGELRERIKQLEDTNKKLYEIGKEIGKQHKYTSENYIPKSKVEEKIEELNKLITEAQKELGSASKEYIIYVYQKDILEELLEKRK